MKPLKITLISRLKIILLQRSSSNRKIYCLAIMVGERVHCLKGSLRNTLKKIPRKSQFDFLIETM